MKPDEDEGGPSLLHFVTEIVVVVAVVLSKFVCVSANCSNVVRIE